MIRINHRKDETYWGSIDYAKSGPVSLKQMVMRAGEQSSLEYHTKKHEIYWLLSGKLRVGFREGRGTNKSIVLNPGDCLYIEPGDMHMRIAVEDCVILEACCFENEDTTHIVEDGKSYKHVDRVPGTMDY